MLQSLSFGGTLDQKWLAQTTKAVTMYKNKSTNMCGTVSLCIHKNCNNDDNDACLGKSFGGGARVAW